MATTPFVDHSFHYHFSANKAKNKCNAFLKVFSMVIHFVQYGFTTIIYIIFFSIYLHRIHFDIEDAFPS